MRLAIIADPIDNQRAGIHVFTREMTLAMIRTNPGHEILLIRERKDPALKGAKQIPIWNTRLPLGFATIRLFFLIPRILRRQKTDVVIEPAHFGPFNLPGTISRVTFIHDLTPILFPDLHRWHSQFLQKIFLRRILNKANLIVANSDNTRKDICNVYPENCHKVKRIYPGISAIYKPITDPGIPGKLQIRTPYFLFVGTLEPRKNLRTLLEAFRIFKEGDREGYTLVIAGGKGWKSEPFFRELLSHPFKKDIACIGYVATDALPGLYTRATALIYPSLYEGFGLPVAEAMSCGTPVITANNSSLPEAGGRLALYFDATDAEGLAKRIREVSADTALRERLSGPMSEHVKKFDWDIFATEFWKLLEEFNSRSPGKK
jgi:glycosyltransferase involved in cell wall biosynthesis